ncbi:alpha/beta hydrolase [Roseateles cellulosilyticus]|uniref:Alpha/beta fold hydrolase n=1 Tax=Pelomonas cellulosilytica TaxID=2906762 RepID=A0ABS8XXQ6_9BURK|nr:alpha/beta fold hydrolase [Pelomonas sp. P8]MCE4557439.1 alpha/beta fold hydrolase [Pelomonas sp. P8]
MTSLDARRPAVLLFHGLCANPLELAPVAKSLREAGYVVETPAMAGYGVSSKTGEQLPVPPFEHWLNEAEALFDRLAATHGRVAVGGLCMGAVLALALAARRPAAALVLISTTLHFDGWNVSPWRRLLPLAYLPPLRRRMSFKETAPFGLKNERLRAWVEQAMASDQVSAVGAARLSAASLYEATRLIRHVRGRLGALSAPAIVLHATEDDVSGPRSVHELQQRLAQEPEVHWFHDSYHMLTLDNERIAVARTVRDFLLRRLPPAPFRHPTPGALYEQHA